MRGPGTPITLQAGQTLKDVAFRLTPAGTITGRVTDSVGEPMAGITIQFLRPTYAPNGKRTFANVTNTRTNDLGEYRLYWVTPGQYYINANPSGGYIQTLVQAQVNTAVGAARAQDPANSATNASAALLETLLGLNANEVIEPGFAVTYFPGTTDGSKAAPISVQPGAESRANELCAREGTNLPRARPCIRLPDRTTATDGRRPDGANGESRRRLAETTSSSLSFRPLLAPLRALLFLK